MEDHVWSEVQGFPRLTDEVVSALRRLDPLRRAWDEAAAADPASFQRTRARILRSHAVETGIIEQLYDVDWGITEALVAEGISQDVVERAGGGVDRETLAIIHDQYEALEFVSEVARGERPISVGFVRELHQLITRHQQTYDATDMLGNPVHPPLIHGDWKRAPNHVTRPDGSVMQYCPPARVQDQMEAMIDLLAADSSHPVVRAAWLHHRFIAIHPFQDGNGRVARALVLLELLKGRFAPLVVSRDLRGVYIDRLDRANEGDLDPLILLFADLERQAMVRQFQEPLRQEPSGSVLDVARAAAAKLAQLQEVARLERGQKLAEIANAINARLNAKFASMKDDLTVTFRAVDPAARVWVRSANIGDDGATHFHGQIVSLARRHQFFANLSDGTWWTTLNVKLLSEQLRLLVCVAKVGSGETGIGQVIIAGERLFESEDGPRSFEWLFEPTGLDQVPLTGDSDVMDVWIDVDQLVDRCLSAAIVEFTRTLG